MKVHTARVHTTLCVAADGRLVDEAADVLMRRIFLAWLLDCLVVGLGLVDRGPACMMHVCIYVQVHMA